MTQHILLFGASGQLGIALTHSLTAAGYEVTALDRAACDFATVTEKQLEIKLRAVDPVIAINAAAYTAVDRAEQEADLAYRINAETPALLAHICATHTVPLLHFSTDYVFDGAKGSPYREIDPTRPLGIYAESKGQGEEAVRAHGAHVLRLQWVYGGPSANFYRTMRRLMAERDELRVVADQIGAPSFTGHLAAAITAAVPLITAGTLPADLYHLAAAGHTSWHGFACAIARATGRPTRIHPIVSDEYPLPAKRPIDTRLNTSKLAAYGIAMPHWGEGLADCIATDHL